MNCQSTVWDLILPHVKLTTKNQKFMTYVREELFVWAFGFTLYLNAISESLKGTEATTYSREVR